MTLTKTNPAFPASEAGLSKPNLFRMMMTRTLMNYLMTKLSQQVSEADSGIELYQRENVVAFIRQGNQPLGCWPISLTEQP